jgi:hypothetical protein
MRQVVGKLKNAFRAEKAMKAKVFSSWKDEGILNEELEKELNSFLKASIERENASASPPVVKLVTQSESHSGSGPVSITVIVWYE